MIVGSYSLTLYCKHGSVGADDGCKAPGTVRLAQSRAEYHGPEEAYCRKLARQHGWVLHKDETATCPWCSGRRKSGEGE